jgi:hypothetical protein
MWPAPEEGDRGRWKEFIPPPVVGGMPELLLLAPREDCDVTRAKVCAPAEKIFATDDWGTCGCAKGFTTGLKELRLCAALAAAEEAAAAAAAAATAAAFVSCGDTLER